jgi:hypothetical protein
MAKKANEIHLVNRMGAVFVPCPALRFAHFYSHLTSHKKLASQPMPVIWAAAIDAGSARGLEILSNVDWMSVGVVPRDQARCDRIKPSQD